MQGEANFLVYKSSAGSGKTYTLAKEYLKLALRSPFYYRRILAVTFTNKAADEMKERVLSFLKALAYEGQSALSDELEDHLQIGREELRTKALQVLRNILHDYSAFAVSTIDTFFNQVIRAFTREIGLQGGFEIEMDLDNVLKEIIDKMLADLSDDSILKDWLVAFARERLQEGKSYEFREDIRSLAYELFKEQYKALESSLDGLEIDKEKIKSLNRELGRLIGEFRKTLKGYGTEGLRIIAGEGLKATDFSRGASGVVGQFLKWSAENFDPPTKTALDGTEEVSKWFTKKSPLKDRIEMLASSQLMPLLAAGISYYQENLNQYQTAVEVRKYLYVFGILNDLTTKVREYREEKEVILISDLPQFLRKIIDDSDTPYIYEKVGTRYQHFLIDEFQDTSAFQWSNFRPLVTNSLASGNFNMIVGDVKQSIYRWRGGDADLLLTKAADEVGQLLTSEKMLARNFRSYEEVIDFNNEIFQVTPLLLQEHLMEEIAHLSEEQKGVAIRRIEFMVKSYEGAAQDKPEGSETGGHVKVKFSAKPGRGEEGNWDDLAVKWAIDQIEEVQQRGVPLQDIAVLVRDSGQEGKLVRALGLHSVSPEAKPGCKYGFVSAQAMYLTNASVVNFLLAVFKYLNNQKEEIAIREIIHEYQRHILESEEDLHDLFTKELQHFLPVEFTRYIHTLGRFPLYELTEILIRVFKLEKKSGELAYLQAFQDAVLDYSKTEKGDLASFLTWWDLKGKKRTVRFSDNMEAIKILTIHKSKGLEYHTVIIPFCNWKMDHNTLFSNILWAVEGQQEPYKGIPAIPLRYSANLSETLFAEDYFDEKIRAFHDNLNLLYVAFTRAEKNLLVHAQIPGKSSTAMTISDLLYDHLSESPDYEQGTQVFSKGISQSEEEKERNNATNEVLLTNYISNKWRSKLTIRKKSGDYFDFTESARQLKVNIGKLTHRVLSEIRYLDEMKAVVKSAYMNMEITREDSERLMINISELFRNEQIARWYSRDYEVRNEVVVLPKDGRIRRLDRVIIKDGVATIIDFKTGKPVSSDKLQVMGYIRLLNEMDYQEVSGYLVYLNGYGSIENEEDKSVQIIQVG